MKNQVLKSATCNNFGMIIPEGTSVRCEFVEGSNLIKCTSDHYGVFYTGLDNLRENDPIFRTFVDPDEYISPDAWGEFDCDDFDPTDNPCECEQEYGCIECNPNFWK